MAVSSKSIELGSTMPEFTLPDPEGKLWRGKELFGPKGLLVAFTCNHCPYALAIWPRLIALAKFASPLGVNVVGINPNAANPDYPEDGVEPMKVKIREWGIPFPYLVDKTQETARAFDAQCTPDLYLYGADTNLAYHGRLDDNWQEPSRVTKQELKAAIEALVAGKPVSREQFSSLGCSIKWKE